MIENLVLYLKGNQLHIDEKDIIDNIKKLTDLIRNLTKL